YDPAMSPATARPTLTAGQLDPVHDQGGVFGAESDQSARLGGYESDIRQAQSRGQDVRNSMLSHYETDVLPVGAAYGDYVVLPPSPLDPGVGSLGVTDPSGAFYDPPRGYGGAQGAPGYQGEAQ